MTLAGLPHSDISGSKRACRSPKLIAACHVLHRLSAPRHPPSTLSNLTIKCLELMRSALRIPLRGTRAHCTQYSTHIQLSKTTDREDRRSCSTGRAARSILAGGKWFTTRGGRALFRRATDRRGGADRDRTDDLLNASQALSQLSYSPTRWLGRRRIEEVEC